MMWRREIFTSLLFYMGENVTKRGAKNKKCLF